MLDQINIEKVLFLDIETVPQYPEYEMLPEEVKKLWNHKAQRLTGDPAETAENLYERAGIYAEFGRIICISVGFIRNGKLRIKSFSGDDEAVLLNEFAGLLNQSFNKPDMLLCAHNGKEFDFPYIARRMLINGIGLPALLDIAGKSPGRFSTSTPWSYGSSGIIKAIHRSRCSHRYSISPRLKMILTEVRLLLCTGKKKT